MIIFDIKGKFAHFRKFYSNSSSLSYDFPPRTTVEGIIASILGYDFDSYYDMLNLKHAIIAVSTQSRIRKYIGTLNYMKIVDSNNFYKNLSKSGYDYTQIPYEMIIPDSFVNQIVYRIFFHSTQEIMDDLSQKIKNNIPVFPVSLGTANMIASLNYIDDAKIKKIYSENLISVRLPTPTKFIKKIKLENNNLRKEIVPVNYDSNRNPKTCEYVYDVNNNYYKINTDKSVLQVNYRENDVEKEEMLLVPEVDSNEFFCS